MLRNANSTALTTDLSAFCGHMGSDFNLGHLWLYDFSLFPIKLMNHGKCSFQLTSQSKRWDRMALAKQNWFVLFRFNLLFPHSKIGLAFSIYPHNHHVCPTDLSDQVLRVFKADQQSRYIMIGKDTTAKEVVAQAIREFAVTAAAEAYSLCEVSVTPEGVIKQRRLPDQLSKLADRIQLSGR